MEGRRDDWNSSRGEVTRMEGMTVDWNSSRGYVTKMEGMTVEWNSSRGEVTRMDGTGSDSRAIVTVIYCTVLPNSCNLCCYDVPRRTK